MVARAKAQRVLLICDGADEHSDMIRDNAKMALHYARINFDVWERTSTKLFPALESYTCVLLCAEDLQPFETMTIACIRAYVERGGGLSVLYRSWHQDFCDLFGMNASSDWPTFLVDEDAEGGMAFISETLPAFEGIVFGQDEFTGHVPFDVTPVEGAEVIVENARGHPLAWIHRFGDGRVLYWNTAVLAEKSQRGLIVQSVNIVQGKALQPIANLALIHIDDFPPPWAEELYEPAATEFPGASAEQFYYDVWHRDMLELSERYGLAYSYYSVFDYAGVADPFIAPDAEDRDTAAPGFHWDEAKKVQATSELGLHGYNHVPLTLDHWDSQATMEASLKVCRQLWTKHLDGALPYSYVPPNNEYDAAGARALTAVFPEIKVICSTYTGTGFDNGGNREFGPEPWNENLFALPRATSGCVIDIGHHARMISQIESLGVWTHMTHPDDIFDTPSRAPEGELWRNADSRFWRATNLNGDPGLKHKLADWIALVKERFPWLRFVDTRTGVPILKTYLGTEFHVEFLEGAVTVSGFRGAHFHLRLNDTTRINPTGSPHVQLLHAKEYDGFAVYTFVMDRSKVTIELM